MALGNPFTYKEASLFYALWPQTWTPERKQKMEILIKVHESHSLLSFNGSILQLFQMRAFFKDLQSLYKQLTVRENIKMTSGLRFRKHFLRFKRRNKATEEIK